MIIFPRRKPNTLQSSPRQERLDARTNGSGSRVAHKNPLTSIFLCVKVISSAKEYSYYFRSSHIKRYIDILT